MIPTEKKLYELKINPEFQKLIPPLKEKEYEQLEANVIDNGCQDTIKVWDGVIVDGHNRYKICTEHGIEFNVHDMTFSDRNAAIIWIIENQFGRRNLIPFHRSELALVLKPLVAERARAKQLAAQNNDTGRAVLQISVKQVAPIHTDEEIAKRAGVSRDTIRKVEAIKESGTDEQLARARIGGKRNSINAIYTEIKEQGIEEKECRRCGAVKPKDEFLTGTTLCKECRKDIDRERLERTQAPHAQEDVPEHTTADEQEAVQPPPVEMTAREMSKLFDKITSGYSNSETREYTADDLKEELDAMVSDFSKKLSTAFTIHQDILRDKRGVEVALLSLSSAEESLRKLKEVIAGG